jgi:hydrogenase/urease accessory protein HupE
MCLLVTAVPAHCHNLPMGGSRWCLGKNGIIANIDLNQNLVSEIKGVKEGHFDLESSSDEQLRRIAAEILQPYINRRLTLSVNGRAYPVTVDKLVRNGNNSLYTIWLSIHGIHFDKPENALKIEYRLLFEETNNTHLNMAFLYKTDATGTALQKVFDYSPPEGQFNFASSSPVWALSVAGAAPVPAIMPTSAAVPLPVAGAGLNTKRQHAAAQRGVSALKAPDKRPATSARGGVATPAQAAHSAASVVSESSRNGQNRDTREGLPVSDTAAGHVPEGRAKGDTPSIGATIGTFIRLGIEHILTGYDHIAFLIGLIVIGLSFREVLKIITAFTIAHSITLLLAALQVISLNSRFVESVIAFSICYIALENLFRKEVRYRWVITFCFGLVHGFGFASALQELIVGKSNLILPVLSFNFGVETGQLMIFFVLLPVMYLLRQKMEFRKVTVGVSMAIFIFGFTWLVERLFDLRLISS